METQKRMKYTDKLDIEIIIYICPYCHKEVKGPTDEKNRFTDCKECGSNLWGSELLTVSDVRDMKKRWIKRENKLDEYFAKEGKPKRIKSFRPSTIWDNVWIFIFEREGNNQKKYFFQLNMKEVGVLYISKEYSTFGKCYTESLFKFSVRYGRVNNV